MSSSFPPVSPNEAELLLSYSTLTIGFTYKKIILAGGDFSTMTKPCMNLRPL